MPVSDNVGSYISSSLSSISQPQYLPLRSLHFSFFVSHGWHAPFPLLTRGVLGLVLLLGLHLLLLCRGLVGNVVIEGYAVLYELCYLGNLFIGISI
jgi:hypothetical protein